MAKFNSGLAVAIAAVVALVALGAAVMVSQRYAVTGHGEAHGNLVVDTWTFKTRVCHPNGCEPWKQK